MKKNLFRYLGFWLVFTSLLLLSSCSRPVGGEHDGRRARNSSQVKNPGGTLIPGFPESNASVVISGTVRLARRPGKEGEAAKRTDSVVIYATNLPHEWHFHPSNTPVSMCFRGGKLIPYQTCVQVGQPLSVTAEDGKAHMLGTVFKQRRPWSSPNPPPLCPHSFVFKTPEEGVRIRCDIHAEEMAYVTIVSHPFFAVSKEDGSFHFPRGLPPGRYSLRAFHPDYGHVQKEVTLLEE